MLDFAKQRLLVIAPHPDDEVIGCGGLIKKIKDAGGEVYVLFLTVGDTHDFTSKGISTQAQREKEIEAVAKFLGYDSFDIAFLGNEYHLRLDTLGQKALMDVIERESELSIEKVRPTIVAMPAVSSYNQDHAIASRATHASLRAASKVNKHLVEIVLSWESPADQWSLDSREGPNFFVPLTDGEFRAKAKALALYKSQTRAHPNARSAESLRALATLRGSGCGSTLAEGFFINRLII